MERKLVYYPNDMLRQKAQEVRQFNRAEIESLAADMRQIMIENYGMGLAAPQVSDPHRIIVVEYMPAADSDEKPIPFTILINPKITEKSQDQDELNEGCLSIPYVEIPIERATSITVEAQDPDGKSLKFKAKGLFARIIQHEIDHLDGKLILDYDTKQASYTADKPKTIVWGSTKFTTTLLNTIRSNFNVTHIVTEPAKPSGRKQELTPTVAKHYADTLGIPTIEPHDLHDPKLYTYLLSLKPDLMIVAAYGRLIPESLYTLPKHGTLNVHPSLLPKYRGATPIQSALLAGDDYTGVTIMQLAPQFDTGAIIAQSRYDLHGSETFEDLEFDLADLGGQMLKEIMPEYLAGKLDALPQNEQEATKTTKITRDMAWLNLSDSPEINERKVRAFYPEPGAFVILEDKPLKILAAHVEDNTLVFDTIQPAGKKSMSWQDFQRGYRKALYFQPYQGTISK